MSVTETLASVETIRLRRASSDNVLEQAGWPIESEYVELFWLPILGPTATWLLRRLAARVDSLLPGTTTMAEISLPLLGASLGVPGNGKHAPLNRALQRVVQFHVVGHDPDGTYAVPQHVHPLCARHLRRLPEPLAIACRGYDATRAAL